MWNVQSFRNTIRVAVVDDDEDIHLYLKDILQSSNNFSFAGSFTTAAQALNGLPSLRPNLALVDVRLPDLNGIECATRLKQTMPHLKIIVVTGTHETEWADASREAGAEAYLVKPFDGEQLLATLRFVSNEQIGTKSVKISLLLTQREKEVLNNLADGLLYKEISDKLGISYSAVHKYVDHIYRKLEVSNRSEAIRIWIDRGNS